MSWNIGDRPVVEAVVAPHPSNPSGVASAATCTFTKPDGTVGTPVVMTLSTGTWRCTGPTIDQGGTWKYKVNATLNTGETGAESDRFVTVD